MRLSNMVFSIGLIVASACSCFAGSIGAGTGFGENQVDTPGGTRTNVDTLATINLPAGSYKAFSFTFNAGQNGNVQPFLATSPSPNSYTVVAAGSDNVVTSNGVKTVPFGGSNSFSGGQTIYAGITNSAPSNPVLLANSATATDHNAPAFPSPVSVGNSLNSFSNPNLPREYAFSVGFLQENNTSQNGAPYALPGNQLNLNLTGVVTGSLITGQEGTSSDVNKLSNGTTGTGNFGADQSTEVVAINDTGSITYNLPHLSDITSIRTFTEWRDGGRVNQDYSVSYSTDYVNFSPLDTVSYLNGIGGSDINTSVLISGGPSPTLITARAIRFDFNGVQNHYVGFTELGVFGQVVPEPSSAVLLALGGVALLARRRKQNS